MADYHRFVAYIYEYVNGKKMQNTGFAKIELRNAICRIQIHIQNIRMLDGKTEVFGIVRQPKESRKNNPIILLIGEGQTQGSGFDRRFTVPEEPFVEESYRFEQVCGIYIRSQSGRNWMTVFDDEPIAIENLGKPEEAVAEIEEEMTETEEKTVKENEPEEENIKIKENKKSEKTFEQNEYEKIDDNTFLISGSVSLYELKKILNTNIPEGDYDTLSGYLLEELGRLPEEGEEAIVETKDVTYKVEEYEEKRIMWVKACKNNEANIENETKEKE